MLFSSVAVNMNILGSRRALQLAKGMKNLESYLHLSTAYAYANRRWMEVKEDTYELNMPYLELIEKSRYVLDCQNIPLILAINLGHINLIHTLLDKPPTHPLLKAFSRESEKRF